MSCARGPLRRVASPAEQLLAFQLRAVGITFHREHKFHPERKWRADFLLVDEAHAANWLVEVDGGSWIGGRHTSGSGFEADCLKLCEAAILGYRTLRVTPRMVEDGRALAIIERALRRPVADDEPAGGRGGFG